MDKNIVSVRSWADLVAGYFKCFLNFFMLTPLNSSVHRKMYTTWSNCDELVAVLNHNVNSIHCTCMLYTEYRIYCIMTFIWIPAKNLKILLYQYKVIQAATIESWQSFHFSPFYGAAPRLVCGWHHHYSLSLCCSSYRGSGSRPPFTHLQ